MVTQENFSSIMRKDINKYKIKTRYSPTLASKLIGYIRPLTEALSCDSSCRYLTQLENQLRYIIRYGSIDGKEKVYSTDRKNARPSGWGRLTADKGVSYINITRPVRHYLASPFYSDIDIVNCHPTLITQLQRAFNLESTHIERWNNLRESAYLTMIRLSSKRITRDDCKTLGFTFLYEGDVDASFVDLGLDKTNSELGDLYKLCCDCSKSVLALRESIFSKYPSLWSALPFDPDKGDIRCDVGKFSSLMQHLERHIMLICADIAKHEFQYEIGDYCHDGLLLSNNGAPIEDLTEFFRKAEDAVQASTGFNIQLTEKKMSPKFIEDFLAKCVVSASDSRSYLAVRQQFEKNHLKIANKAIWIKELPNCIIIGTKSWLEIESAEVTYDIMKVNKDGESTLITVPLLSKSSPYWSDPDKRMYDDMCSYPPPIVCPKGMYNTWLPFAADLSTEYTKRPEALEKILNHIKILCNHEEKIYDYIVKWIAQMIQYPGIKTVMPSFTGSPGCGKGLFTDLLKAMLGEERVLVTTTPDRDIFGEFNGSMANAFLVVLNEAEKAKIGSGYNQLKALVTDLPITINLKGGCKYETKFYGRIMQTSNNLDPLPTERSDRRAIIIRCSDEKCGDKEYGKEIATLIKDLDVVRTCFDYFKAVPNMDNFLTIPLPCTEYHQELKESSESIHIQWLRSYVSNDNQSDNIVTVSMSDLCASFSEWCERYRIESKVTPQKLGMILTNNRVPGLTKIQGKWVCYTLNLSLIRQHLGIMDICPI
jgi:hypothetical protein